jgi:hypothetical protein
MDHPTNVHYQATMHVLRYLKNSLGMGLFFPTNSDFNLFGYCLFLGSSQISWKAKKQTYPSRSSAEAEYRALAVTTCEIQWISNLLRTMDLPLSKPCNLFYDNLSAIHIAKNDSFHERTKHIDLDWHTVCHKLRTKLIHLLPVKSEDQLADILTKPLPREDFYKILSKIGMIDVHSPSCGGVTPEILHQQHEIDEQGHHDDDLLSK